MGKPTTLLEGLCAHALSFDSQSLTVERKDRREWVFMMKAGSGIPIANYASSSADAKELRENLHAAHKKPLRTAIAGRVWIIKVRATDSSGEDALSKRKGRGRDPFCASAIVTLHPAPALDPAAAPAFTKKQGQYLAFIYNYTKIHRRAPAELDLQLHFQVTPPSVHQMILTLELKRFIERTPGQARSIRLLVAPEHLPRLE